MFVRSTSCVWTVVTVVFVLGGSVGHAQVITSTAPQDMTSTAPIGVQDRIYTAPAGMMFHPILPDKTADFEDVITRLRDALNSSTDETHRAQALGWKVYRAVEPGPPDQTSVLYVFVIDPAVGGADYTIGEMLRRELPLEAQTLYEKFAASYAYSPSLINVQLLADFAAAGAPTGAVGEP